MGGKLAERGLLANTRKKLQKWWWIRMWMAMLKRWYLNKKYSQKCKKQ